jgi:hypothetical protein
MENRNNTATAKGLTTKKIILILGIVVIVCAAAVTVILLTRPSLTGIADNNTPIGNLVVDENNLEQIKKELDEKVAKGMFETHMNTTWTFPDGQSASVDAVMGNSVNNNYPFWFELTLAGAKEVIYTSSILPVGSQLAEIVLDTPLDKGTYPATVYIHMVDENNEPVESNMGFSITLVVQK